ncbi:TPR_11 domain-containing protein [Cephalotus follicularis]|uniref:TPR_11 domain-containing protein n=1 Tax=Cephalotus follicularis TaxID=3775 RepID=A0A1Q3B2G4_CEPFO|nr:TPR_11 domain-containing protein [Cephalotus follicularis]
MLRTEPSFCIYNDGFESEQVSGPEGFEGEEVLKRTVTIGESIEGISSDEFSFGKKHMGLIEEQKEEEASEEGEEKEQVLDGIKGLIVAEEIEQPSSPMYLAAGLGIDGAGFGGGGVDGIDFNLPNFAKGGDAEEYYKKKLDEYPCHPLLLRNFAQLLKTKGDFHGAEEYYRRATLADPDDGEILSKYAKLIWEIHHDQDRALSYFEQAAEAAPQDSHVLAEYASFLWEIDNDGEEDSAPFEHMEIEEKGGLNELDNSALREGIPARIHIDVAGPTSTDANDHHNVEEYYRKKIEENPSNALFLRNYAQFLHKSMGDLQGAEEYYLRAILCDSRDGEMISQYAKLVWELHHDHDRALSYYEQAVQATPEDSNVLGAYACFLWETEDEEDNAMPYQLQMPVLHAA